MAQNDPAAVFGRWVELPDIDTGKIYRANLNVRDVGATEEMLQAVIQETISFWYRAARNLTAGVFEEEGERWALREHTLEVPPYHNKSAVTVWGEVTTPDGRTGTITMTEDGLVHPALTLAKLALAAERAVKLGIEKNLSAQAKNALANKPAAAPDAPHNAPAPEGAQDIKIVKISHKVAEDGVPYFGLFGLLPNGAPMEYPMTRIYTDAKGEKNYLLVKDGLPDIAVPNELNGEWVFRATVVKSTNSKGKEVTYYNPVSLTRVK